MSTVYYAPGLTQEQIDAGREAVIVFQNGRYEVIVDGVVIMKSNANAKYLEDRLRYRDNHRVQALNVTRWRKISSLDAGSVAVESNQSFSQIASATPETQFETRIRVECAKNVIRMVIHKMHPAAILAGSPGIGKSKLVRDELAAAGKQHVSNLIIVDDDEEESTADAQTDENGIDIPSAKTLIHFDDDATIPGDYVMFKGDISARGLYDSLYENRDKICVFDDCDSVFKTQAGRDILKNALDSYEDDRWICWAKQAPPGDTVPRRFKFTGQIIFITNLTLEQIHPAVRSRSQIINLEMSRLEILNWMACSIDGFMPNYDHKVKVEALEFLRENHTKASRIDFRTWINIVKIIDSQEKLDALYPKIDAENINEGEESNTEGEAEPAKPMWYYNAMYSLMNNK